MKRILQLIMIASIATFCSCGGGAKVSEADLDHMADSMAAPRMQELDAKATSDCEARMSTEVKTIVDSLVTSAKK